VDWAKVVETWVAEGLVTEAQAPALRDWLARHGPRTTPLADIALTVVALAGAWLLTGASVLLVVYLDGEAWQAGSVALLSALVWAGVGFVTGRTVNPAAGQGLVSSAVVIAPLAFLAIVETEPGRLDPGAWTVTLLPAVVGTAFAVLRRQATLAVAASMAASILLVPWIYEQPMPWPETLFIASLLYAAIPNGLAYRAQLDGDDSLAGIAGTLQAQVAFTVFIAINAAFAHDPYTGGFDARLWESGTAIMFLGFALLGLGALGRSRMTLVGGLIALVVAEITFLTAFGDVMAAIVILGLEGLVLIAAVAAVVAARAGRAQRDGGD